MSSFEVLYSGLEAVQFPFAGLGLPDQSGNVGSVRLGIQVNLLNGWDPNWVRSRPTKDASPDGSRDPRNSKFSLLNLSLNVPFSGKSLRCFSFLNSGRTQRRRH